MWLLRSLSIRRDTELFRWFTRCTSAQTAHIEAFPRLLPNDPSFDGSFPRTKPLSERVLAGLARLFPGAVFALRFADREFLAGAGDLPRVTIGQRRMMLHLNVERLGPDITWHGRLPNRS